MIRTRLPCFIICCFIGFLVNAQAIQPLLNEPHRPRFHFSPKSNWMNDPNGLIFYKGTYHLFFQHFPGATVWGPMHWGHATSPDLVHWEQQSITLYPDSLGYIFSGSIVLDPDNTSGFGKKDNPPMVAIFTHHDPKGEKASANDFQSQSLAYSTDAGDTWTKYKNNPVLKSPGIRDFRDPKVSWFEPAKKWIMTLAAGDRIVFYSSGDLKNWSKESEFGMTLGSHGGVWECPDLIELNHQGKKLWVLLISIGSGGPNGGSATQYFIGHFNGKTFIPSDTSTRFVDYGTDNYAGVTFSNTGSRKIFMGWMSNWQYAQVVPTDRWRSAMTVPRDLFIKPIKNKLYLASRPVKELGLRMKDPVLLSNVYIKGKFDLRSKINELSAVFSLQISSAEARNFKIVLSNDAGEQIHIGYDRATNRYYMDRTQSGKIDFSPSFGNIHFAPRYVTGPIRLTLLVDVASLELFSDDGVSVMTDIFFPNQPMNTVYIQSDEGIKIKKMRYHNIE